jgi:hypothetical protein
MQSSAKFSYEEREQAVRNFIVACYHDRARIKSYERLASLLNKREIKLLHPLEKSGSITKDADGVTIHDPNNYSPNDAETYFEWLVAVVNETENVGEDIRKEANDQLFRFLYVMRADIERDKDVQLIALYDWQQLFLSFDDRLTEMQRIIDKGDKDIAETLSKILEWIKKVYTIMDAMKKESDELFGNEPKNERPH